MQELHHLRKRSPCLLLHPTDPEIQAYFPAEFIHVWGGQLEGFLPPTSHVTEELGGRTTSVSKRAVESEKVEHTTKAGLFFFFLIENRVLSGQKIHKNFFFLH